MSGHGDSIFITFRLFFHRSFICLGMILKSPLLFILLDCGVIFTSV